MGILVVECKCIYIYIYVYVYGDAGFLSSTVVRSPCLLAPRMASSKNGKGHGFRGCNQNLLFQGPGNLVDKCASSQAISTWVGLSCGSLLAMSGFLS